mmetsp:Transcript_11883/g.19345  ORF Transcript_11883/g.19345 Transcript_11883/m.19345 type:complete len:104 (+) Transcript_11883:70-381(+)
MAEKAVVQKEVNPTNEQHNWEQRINTELSSGGKWNENWGTLFNGAVPNDYKNREQYLLAEIAKMKDTSSGVPRSEYGSAPPIKEVGKKDYRRKKMFGDDPFAE